MELTNLISSSATVDIYQEGNMAIKVFKEGCPKTMALYEALTHSRVEATGLRVPVIHEVSVIGNRWAIHMDCIEGKTLAQVMKDDPANKDKYISDMVDIQIEVHSKQVPKLSKLKDKMTRQINSLDCIDDATKYELLARLDSRPKHIKLCHGNFTPENIIINENGTYIVDWVAARQGQRQRRRWPHLPAAVPERPGYGGEIPPAVLRAYQYLEKYVQEWLPIVAAAQLTENKPEERDLLMKWVGVVAYE